jgi:hypothetical protein
MISVGDCAVSGDCAGLDCAGVISGAIDCADSSGMAVCSASGVCAFLLNNGASSKVASLPIIGRLPIVSGGISIPSCSGPASFAFGFETSGAEREKGSSCLGAVSEVEDAGAH